MRFLEGLVLRLLYGKGLQKAYLNRQIVDRRKIPRDRSSLIRTDTLMRSEDSTYCSWSTIEKGVLRKVEEELTVAAQAYLRGAR